MSILNFETAVGLQVNQDAVQESKTRSRPKHEAGN